MIFTVDIHICFRELKKVIDGGLTENAKQALETMDRDDQLFSKSAFSKVCLSLENPIIEPVVDLSWRPEPCAEFANLSYLGEEYNDSDRRPIIAIDVDKQHKNSAISDQISKWLQLRTNNAYSGNHWPYGFQNNNFICHFIASFQLMAALIIDQNFPYRNSFYPLVEGALRAYIRGRNSLENETLLFIAKELLTNGRVEEQQDVAEYLLCFFLCDTDSSNMGWNVSVTVKHTCSKCSYIESFPQFTTILNITFTSGSKSISVQSLLDAHIAKHNGEVSEFLGTCNCCGTKKHAGSTQSNEYVAFPRNILFLQIMRFTFNSKTAQIQKSFRKVTLSETIKIECGGVQYIYDLTGIIVHSGNSI